MPQHAPTPNTRRNALSESDTTLAELDRDFEQVGCLGHGGFGSVFLARKESGRYVALKFTSFDLKSSSDLEEAQWIWERELEFVLQLETEDSDSNRQTSSIVFFQDWFTGTRSNTNPQFACLVMKYADGGTLQQEIVRKGEEKQPYTERRIAWYASQLIGALAFAHRRGVAHHDVKSSNVLIDRTGGGTLVLADWGSAVAPGEESIKMTTQYAAPELLAAVANQNLEGLQPEKIDAFGVGCILFELLSCQKQTNLMGEGDDVFGEFIGKNGVEAALNLPCIRLPWLDDPLSSSQQQPDTRVGYSHLLKGLIRTLLEGNPQHRWTPNQLEKPLQEDPQSPLLYPYLKAAHTAVPGTVVTLDNIQLGMFVQRGPHWTDGDSDGGLGSVGVVVRIDADAVFTEVVFPSQNPGPKSLVCRIGSRNRFELQVGPAPFHDFTGRSNNSISNGIVDNIDVSMYAIGQMVNDKCMIAHVNYTAKFMIMAPMERIQIEPVPFQVPQPLRFQSCPKAPLPPPDCWKPNSGNFVEVTDPEERGMLVELFYDTQGGLDIQSHEIVSIQRVQVEQMWREYAEYRETLALENWGIANEKRLFHGTGMRSPASLLSSPTTFYQMCISGCGGDTQNKLQFSASSKAVELHVHAPATNCGLRQVVVSRVALGRIKDGTSEIPPSRPTSFQCLDYHSIYERTSTGVVYSVANSFQAYPEYIISYKTTMPTRHQHIVRNPRVPTSCRIPPNQRVPSSTAIASGTARSTAPSPRVPTACRIPPNQREPSSSAIGSNTANSTAPFTPPAHTTIRAARKLLRHVKESVPISAARNLLQSVTGSVPGPFASSATQAQESLKTQDSGGVSVKECVVCLERAVTHILIPCGHPCLCTICSTKQGLSKLCQKCPECRTTIREAVRFFGKIVED